jgi:hypothetical protein
MAKLHDIIVLADRGVTGVLFLFAPRDGPKWSNNAIASSELIPVRKQVSGAIDTIEGI